MEVPGNRIPRRKAGAAISFLTPNSCEPELVETGDPVASKSAMAGIPAIFGAAAGNRCASLGVGPDCNYTIADGALLAWEEHGAGMAVVCLHALGSGSREFRPLTQQAPTGCRLILVDWPGHGRSSPDPMFPISDPASGGVSNSAPNAVMGDGFRQDLAAPDILIRASDLVIAFLKQIEVDQAILLGHEFGAAVALECAARFPEYAQGLVLCQPAGLVPAASPSPSLFDSHSANSRLGKRLQRWWRSMSPKGNRRPSRTPPSPANAAAGKAGESSAQNPANWNPAKWHRLRKQAIRPLYGMDLIRAENSLDAWATRLQAHLMEASCPIVLALPTNNPSYPLKRLLRLLDPLLGKSQQHRFSVLRGKHSPLWEDTERVAEVVAAFATSLTPLAQHRHGWQLTATDWPSRNLNLWKCIHPECRAEQIASAGVNPNHPAAPNHGQ